MRIIKNTNFNPTENDSTTSIRYIFYNQYINVSTLCGYDTSYNTLVRIVKNKYNDCSVLFSYWLWF